MTVLASAQACGFGPVSKLVAVVGMVGGTPDFIGQGVALDFVRRHRERFGTVDEVDTADPRALAPHLAGADVVLSVMDAELVFWAVRAGKQVLFFDSLLSFWLTQREYPEFADRVETIRHASDWAARATFDSLTPHERVLVAHLLATRSYAQNFPGVRERIDALAAVGAHHIQLCGPIIDRSALAEALSERQPDDLGQMLINLGGFKNFFLDYRTNNAYLHLIKRWLRDLVSANRDLEVVDVCGGAFADAETIEVAGRRIRLRFLPQRDFLRHLAHSPLYAAPASLTSLQEAVVAECMPLLLPEQHYGHVVNLRMLADTAVGRMATSFQRASPHLLVTEDDLAGTRELDRHARALTNDDIEYQWFRAHLDGRLADYRALRGESRHAAVTELAALLDGPPIAELLLHDSGGLVHSGGFQ